VTGPEGPNAPGASEAPSKPTTIKLSSLGFALAALGFCLATVCNRLTSLILLFAFAIGGDRNDAYHTLAIPQVVDILGYCGPAIAVIGAVLDHFGTPPARREPPISESDQKRRRILLGFVVLSFVMRGFTMFAFPF
jgi:hypothetical protein